MSNTRTMLARYSSACAKTGEPIRPGDTIEYNPTTRKATLVSRGTSSPGPEGRYISNVFRTSGGTFYRNKNGRCEDAPCCGCCTI